MRIDSDVYQYMLREFELKVWQEEFTDIQQKITNLNSKKIWNLEEVGINGTNFFEKLFLNDFPLTPRDHFTRKLEEYPFDTVPIKKEFLLTILIYLGVKPPLSATKWGLNDKSKLSNLLYNEYKSTRKDKIETEILYNELTITSEPKNENNFAEFAEDANQNWEKVNRLLKLYYSFIMDLQYHDAMYCWFPEILEKKWENNRFKFTNMYSEIDAIYHLNFFSMNVREEFANCFIIYFIKNNDREYKNYIKIDFVSLIKHESNWFIFSIEDIDPSKVYIEDELYELMNRPINRQNF